MSDHQFPSKKVITRKQHSCAGCRAEIPAGTRCEYSAGIFDGHFYSSYLCKVCEEYMKRHWDKYQYDGFVHGEFPNDDDWHDVKKEIEADAVL